MKNKKLWENFPDSPGIYIMKDLKGRILYIGKAANLRRRVSSYFLRPPARNASPSNAGGGGYKTEKLVREIKKIDYEKTDTAIEALILESKLIKKHEPPYNVREKDDKSFLFVEITKEKFPRVLLSRGKNIGVEKAMAQFGPFTSASSIREALRIIRRVFPYSVHASNKLFVDSDSFVVSDRPTRKACFDYELGLCPGTCIGAITRVEYLKNIKNITFFFEGKKRQIIKSLEREMRAASKALEFEKAEKVRRQIFSLKHIQDVALIKDEKFQITNSKLQTRFRIEGYDVSNISGDSATGAMVVFTNGKSDKNEYRKFKIQTLKTPDPARKGLSPLAMAGGDVGMLKEVLRRRFSRNRQKEGWPLPNLILIDGGAGQVNAAKEILGEAGLSIPIIGIAKGAKRKNNRFIGKIPIGVDERTLIRVRNEAHRFAVAYHKKLRARKSLDSK